VVNPIQFLLFSNNSNSLINNLDFNHLGKSTLIEINAFKKIYYSSNLKKFHISKNLNNTSINQSLFKRFYESESLNSVNSEKSFLLLSTNSMFNLSLNFSDYKSFFKNMSNLISFKYFNNIFLNNLNLLDNLQSNSYNNNYIRFSNTKYQIILNNYY
jgi:hypothetical protein